MVYVLVEIKVQVSIFKVAASCHHAVGSFSLAGLLHKHLLLRMMIWVDVVFAFNTSWGVSLVALDSINILVIYFFRAQVSPCKRPCTSVYKGKLSQAAFTQTMGLICSYESYDFFFHSYSSQEKDEL